MIEYFQIELTNGKIARVSPEDWDSISQHNWYARKAGKKYYACRTAKRGVTPKTIHMHRVVMNAQDGLEVDHIYGNTLDNRRDQLRVCTLAENRRNQPLRCDNRSGQKGVFFLSKYNRWAAKIKFNGKCISLGFHTTKEAAAEAYSQAAKKYHAEFSRLK